MHGYVATVTHRVVVAGLAISLFFTITAAAVWLISTPTWLRVEYGRAAFPHAQGFTDAERMALAIPSTLFLTRPSIASADLAELTHGGTPLYAADEIRHLEDARTVVRRLAALGLAGVVILALAVGGAQRRPRWRYSLARGIEAGGWLTAGAALWLAFVATVAWPLAFVTFHTTLFPAGNWQFSESSGLIRLFPEKFWFDSAVALMLVVILGGVLAIGVGRRARPAAQG